MNTSASWSGPRINGREINDTTSGNANAPVLLLDGRVTIATVHDGAVFVREMIRTR